MGEFSLAPEQQRTLVQLKPLLDKYHLYLAGGGAVAVHLEHRQSLDIDLFSQNSHLDLVGLRDELVVTLSDVRVVGLTDATLRLEVSGESVDIVKYPYPLLEPPLPGPEGVLVAGMRDLAAMKLSAVSQRGIQRDFWDLYVLIQAGIDLSEACDAYLARFGGSHSDLYHVLRALTYFDDAERDSVMPRGMTATLWRTIREYFEHEAPSELGRRLNYQR
ncbi:MAG TPA: nucleotidyl transferase AbiEii/AbiGii toxin family protein [Polyangiaceae bacterium]